MVILDKTDIKILSLLAVDARTPLTTISKKIRLSVEGTGYRIKRLEKEGIVRKYGLYPDELKFGLNTYFVFLRFKTLRKEHEDNYVNYLMKHSQVGCIFSSGGRWDYILVMYAYDIYSFSKCIDHMLTIFCEHLLEYKTVFALEQIIFTQLVGEFFKNVNDPYRRIAHLDERLEKVSLSDKEKTLLAVLDDHGRANFNELSVLTKMPPETVRFTLNKLKKKKVYISTYAALDYFKMGLIKFLLVIKHTFSSQQRMNTFLTYISNDYHIRHVSRMGGANEIIVTVFVSKVEELHTFIRNYENEFPDVVIDTEINQIFKRLKEKLLPARL